MTRFEALTSDEKLERDPPPNEYARMVRDRADPPVPAPKTVFDVSMIFDGEYAALGDRLIDPLAGAHDGMGQRFSRAHYESRLRQAALQANKLHWSHVNLSDPLGQQNFVDVEKLRHPTAAEIKSTKLANMAAGHARDAGHIRAWLAKQDRAKTSAERQARQEARRRLEARAQVDVRRLAALQQQVRDNVEAARRHVQRLRDEEAHLVLLNAQNELRDLHARHSDAKRELDEEALPIWPEAVLDITRPAEVPAIPAEVVEPVQA